MPSTTGKSLEELKAMRKALTDQGKELSTSKELGKIEQAIKVLQPNKYDAKQVESAKANLKLINEPTVPASDGGIPGVDTSTDTGSNLGFNTSGASGVPASIDLNKMYENAMKDVAITSLEKELADKNTAYSTATTSINDNPYYSEGTRTGHIAKLNTTYQIDKQNLTDQIAQKKADVQTKLNIATQQYNINNQEYQNNLSRLNLLISSGALLNASGSDIASIALSTGMSTSMVKGIMSKMKSDAIKPQVINSEDSSGNVTVSVIDANTGNLISQRSLGTIGKGTSGSSTDSKQEALFNAAISTGISQLKQGESWGTVFNRIYSQFSGSVPADALNQLIDQGLGVSWREPAAYQNYAKTLNENKSSGQTINIVNPGSN
jgi:hypothetical protein